MDDGEPPASPRVEELERRVADLERRLRRLERGEATAGAVAPLHAAAASQDEPAAAPAAATALTGGVPASALVTMLGRTCLILGGAWLLRAAVEQGGLGPGLGVALGLAYGAAWHVFADRAARAGRAASALFYGLAAAAIGAPIVWENTVRHGLLEPAVAAPVLGALGLVGLVVAWRGRMQSYAVLNLLAASGAGLTLMVQTEDFLAFGLVLLALAAVAVAMSYMRGWRVLPWLAVVPLDLGICLALVWLRDVDFAARLSPPDVAILFASVWAVFAALVAWRGLQRGGPVGRFDVAQMAFATLAGYEGAHWILDGGAADGLAAAGLLAGLVWCGTALVSGRRMAARAGADFFSGPHVPYVLGLFGVGMLLDGSGRLLPLPIAGMAWAALALAAVAGDRRGLRFLEPFAVLLAAAAAVASGLLLGSFDALAGPATEAWRPLVGPSPMAALVLLALAFVLVPRSRDGRPLAATGIGLLVLGGLGGLLVTLLAGPLTDAPGPTAHAGALALLRTAIIASSALLLAVLYRRTGRRGLSWLTVAVLVAGGVKLVLEDLGVGEAGLLFLSFALYGSALILAPRIVLGASDSSEDAARTS